MPRLLKEIDKKIGERLRARRLLLNMSQEQLADHCELTFQQIQKYEKGTNRVSGSRMTQLADALQCEPSYFVEGIKGNGKAKTNGGGEPIGELMGLVQKPDTIKLLRAFEKIRGDARIHIVRLCETIAADA